MYDFFIIYYIIYISLYIHNKMGLAELCVTLYVVVILTSAIKILNVTEIHMTWPISPHRRHFDEMQYVSSIRI